MVLFKLCHYHQSTNNITFNSHISPGPVICKTIFITSLCQLLPSATYKSVPLVLKFYQVFDSTSDAQGLCFTTIKDASYPESEGLQDDKYGTSTLNLSTITPTELDSIKTFFVSFVYRYFHTSLSWHLHYAVLLEYLLIHCPFSLCNKTHVSKTVRPTTNNYIRALLPSANQCRLPPCLPQP